MTKRKNTGLIRYGTRNYTKKLQKFQEGGFAAVSKAYDWRDDPYELMLLDQKSKEANSRIRANKSSSGATPKIGGMKALTGGLDGATDAANAAFRDVYDRYTDSIKANGLAWVNSEEGQLMHQEIVNYGTQLEYKLKSQKTNFDEALGAIDNQDRNALAISSEGNIMVRRRDDPTQVTRMSLNDYMGNIKSVEALTISDFAKWKKEKDGSMNTTLEDEFLKKNAVDRGSIYDTFIKPFNNTLQYAIEGEKIMKGDGTTKETQWDKTTFRAGLKNILNDGSFEDAAQRGDNSQESFIGKAVTSMFTEIMEENRGDRSRLLASLQAEVLRDKGHLGKLMTITEPNERAKYLNTQVQLALINKVVDEGSKKYSGGTETASTSSDINNVRASGSRGLSTILRFFDGTQTKQYKMGQETIADGEERVVAFTAPMVKGGLQQADLNLNLAPKDENEQKQNKLGENEAINQIAMTGEIYSESGDKLSDLGMPSTFMDKYGVITRGSQADVVMMPYDKDGNMMVKQFGQVTSIKLDIRKAFKKSMDEALSKLDPPLDGIPANKLIPGSRDPKVQAAYSEYLMWVDKSMPDNLARIRKEYEEAENKTPELQANLNQAVAAYSAVDKASKIIKGMFGNVTMMPTLMVNVSFDNDDFDLKGAIEASAKASNYGVGTVQDLDKTEREFLQDTNKIDKTNYFSPDHVYKTNIFMPLKTLQAQANEAGQKTAATIKLGNIDNEAKKFINASGLISNPDMRNTYLFAIN
jgi:hypothetical protein